MGLRTLAAAWIATSLPVLGLLLWPPAVRHRLEPALAGLGPPPMRIAAATPAESASPILAATHEAPEVELDASHDPCAGGALAYRGADDDRVVALTFDDGPSPTVTPAVLDVLREHDVRATFFVLGDPASRHPDTLRELVASGHEIGNHGWSHRSFRSLFPSEIAGELDRTADLVVAAGGVRPRLVRPPFGRFPESSVGLAEGRGEDLVLWSVDGGDTEHAEPLDIANLVVANAEPGAIVLLHDRFPATVRALPLILGGLARKRLRVVPVSELLGIRCGATTSPSSR